MNFDLSPEQAMIQNTARELAAREIAPRAAEIDRSHVFPRDIFSRLGDLGLLGVMLPEKWGGVAMDALSYAVALEEIARACASTAVAMSVQCSLVCAPILHEGNDPQRARWLPDLAAGRKIGCFALSEPEAGSDAKAQRTRAEKTKTADGERWVLNGTKNFITNAPVADVMLVFATTDPTKGSRGITAFLVPMDTPGLKVGKDDDKLGIRGARSAQVFLTDCAVGDDARLGPEGDGFKIAMRALEGGRIGIAAQALGIARAAFEDATRYALERKTFGQPIAEHQAIQFKLADMRTEVDGARLLLWRAAVTKDRGGRYGRDASMAKLFASEVANRVAKEALQIFGGYGYLTDFPAERHYRDAKITEIYEGTSEIQRLVIASALLKE
ncbi:MAG TPA: acyl-CoA dehydrogenase [Polyangia bacterium]|jgi:butyryl-CoA dehydrogenase|nr:acyl-CoA dehydrogenase [Polyangia bacterium]